MLLYILHSGQRLTKVSQFFFIGIVEMVECSLLDTLLLFFGETLHHLVFHCHVGILFTETSIHDSTHAVLVFQFREQRFLSLHGGIGRSGEWEVFMIGERQKESVHARENR